MNNKKGKEDPLKRGKKGMSNKEGNGEPWEKGKKGMSNKEGEEEPRKRGKVKPEKQTKGLPLKWKRKNIRKYRTL